MNFPSVPPSRTVTRVRLRGTSLSSPAAIASDTLIRLIGNASPDANHAEYFMKSRRVGGEPQDWLSIPLSVRRFQGTVKPVKEGSLILFRWLQKGASGVPFPVFLLRCPPIHSSGIPEIDRGLFRSPRTAPRTE